MREAGRQMEYRTHRAHSCLGHRCIVSAGYKKKKRAQNKTLSRGNSSQGDRKDQEGMVQMAESISQMVFNVIYCVNN